MTLLLLLLLLLPLQLLLFDLGIGECKNFPLEEREVPVCCGQIICGFFVLAHLPSVSCFPLQSNTLKVHGSNISSCTIAGQMFRGLAPFWALQVQPAVFLECDEVIKYSHFSTA
jgi:hypothetical protein